MLDGIRYQSISSYIEDGRESTIYSIIDEQGSEHSFILEPEIVMMYLFSEN